ncbi:ASCH domain-containing protein [Fredinandcohnia humi]
MLALSIKQAWATLICYGHKTIELRDWSTKRTIDSQWILIHTGRNKDKNAPKEAWDLVKQYELHRAKKALIGVAYYDKRFIFENEKQFENTRELHLSGLSYQQGLSGMILKDARPLNKPIEYSGRLLFFDVPSEMLPKNIRELT